MIERLQRALERVEQLSTEAQNDLTQEIEELTEELPLPHAPGSAPTANEDSLPACRRPCGAHRDRDRARPTRQR
jgi:hypothetical protein